MCPASAQAEWWTNYRPKPRAKIKPSLFTRCHLSYFVTMTTSWLREQLSSKSKLGHRVHPFLLLSLNAPLLCFVWLLVIFNESDFLFSHISLINHSKNSNFLQHTLLWEKCCLEIKHPQMPRCTDFTWFRFKFTCNKLQGSSELLK